MIHRPLLSWSLVIFHILHRPSFIIINRRHPSSSVILTHYPTCIIDHLSYITQHTIYIIQRTSYSITHHGVPALAIDRAVVHRPSYIFTHRHPTLYVAHRASSSFTYIIHRQHWSSIPSIHQSRASTHHHHYYHQRHHPSSPPTIIIIRITHHHNHGYNHHHQNHDLSF